jgi:hypothetical protein
MVENVGGRYEEGTSNSSGKNASNVRLLFPLILNKN